jgi:predicted Zn-dependent protease
LRFREVGYPDEARIIITLKPGPLMAPDTSIGHASFNNAILNTENPMRQLKVTIMVNTGDQYSDLSIDNRREQVTKLVLHELGHAIGIWGHSKDPNDIMYTHPIVSQLSSRDIKTVRRLYGLQ